MADVFSKLFREESLKQLRNPEQLDTFLKLTSPIGWAALVVIAVAVVVVTVWGFVGHIPVRVEGLGVIITRDSLSYNLTSQATGTVKQLRVTVGDNVNEGDPIMVLDLPISQTQQENAQRKVDTLKANLAHQQTFSKKDIAQRKANAQHVIESLQKTITDTQNHLEFQRSYYKTQQDELKKGYVTRQDVEQTKNLIFSLEGEIRDARSKIQQARTNLVEYENESHRSLAQIQQQILGAENELREAQISVKTEDTIISPTAGIVAEIDVKLGEYIDGNQQVAVIEKLGEDFQALSFFKISDGKKAEPGMHAQVSPTSVERDLYGSIRGKVISIGTLPESQAGLLEALGNEALVTEMMKNGAPIRVLIDLEKDSKTFSGLRWSSSDGPPLKITAATTTATSITVKEEKPINLVIPIFKAWVTDK